MALAACSAAAWLSAVLSGKTLILMQNLLSLPEPGRSAAIIIAKSQPKRTGKICGFLSYETF
jgi:hypothetical protein